jgi:hypothetical protein
LKIAELPPGVYEHRDNSAFLFFEPSGRRRWLPVAATCLSTNSYIERRLFGRNTRAVWKVLVFDRRFLPNQRGQHFADKKGSWVSALLKSPQSMVSVTQVYVNKSVILNAFSFMEPV